MRSLLVPLCALLLLAGAESFSTRVGGAQWGACPDMDVQQSFQLSDYMGTWYIQNGYNLAITQGKGRCGSATYTLDTSDNIVNVYNKQISASTNKVQTISGNAVADDPSKDEGKFTVTLYVWDIVKVTAPYWVLGTDYSSYAVVYSCENFLFTHVYSSWVLSRVRQFNDSTTAYQFYQKVNATLLNHNIDPLIFDKVDQTNCDDTTL